MKEEHPLAVFLALPCIYINSSREIRPIVHWQWRERYERALFVSIWQAKSHTRVDFLQSPCSLSCLVSLSLPGHCIECSCKYSSATFGVSSVTKIEPQDAKPSPRFIAVSTAPFATSDLFNRPHQQHNATPTLSPFEIRPAAYGSRWACHLRQILHVRKLNGP